jgi:hypothetical protein
MNNDPEDVPAPEVMTARPKEVGSAEGEPEGWDLDRWLRAETELCDNFKPEPGDEVREKASDPEAEKASRS